MEFVAPLGFDLISYDHLTTGFKEIPPEKGFRISRLPEAYIEHYVATNSSEFDPLRKQARKRNVPFYWSEIEASPDLSADQKEFFETRRSFGFQDGIVAPVYARPGDIAYFGLGSSIAEPALSKANLLVLQAICQQLHLRHTELTNHSQTPKLSPRETQVLELIALGKSNAQMSKTLGVSPNTIDTLVRRCFEKLGVSSRVEAALAGIAMGLILP